MHSPAESDRYVRVSYEADAPRRRDFWRVLLGRWKPCVRRVERLTAAGMDRELRRAWTPEALERQFYTDNPFID